MNEEMKYFAEDLEELLRKGHKVLNKINQNMGQRRGNGQMYGNRSNSPYREDPGQLGNEIGERNGWPMNYDPRFM